MNRKYLPLFTGDMYLPNIHPIPIFTNQRYGVSDDPFNLEADFILQIKPEGVVQVSATTSILPNSWEFEFCGWRDNRGQLQICERRVNSLVSVFRLKKDVEAELVVFQNGCLYNGESFNNGLKVRLPYVNGVFSKIEAEWTYEQSRLIDKTDRDLWILSLWRDLLKKIRYIKKFTAFGESPDMRITIPEQINSANEILEQIIGLANIHFTDRVTKEEPFLNLKELKKVLGQKVSQHLLDNPENIPVEVSTEVLKVQASFEEDKSSLVRVVINTQLEQNERSKAGIIFLSDLLGMVPLGAYENTGGKDRVVEVEQGFQKIFDKFGSLQHEFEGLVRSMVNYTRMIIYFKNSLAAYEKHFLKSRGSKREPVGFSLVPC